MATVEEALEVARREVAEYDHWGAPRTPLYLATKALIEALEKETA